MLVAAAPAAAKIGDDRSVLNAYAEARAAAGIGEPRRAALGYAAVLALDPRNRTLAARALGQALEAGDRALAVAAAQRLEQTGPLPPDARLLLVGEALRTRDAETALRHIDALEKDKVFAFMAPILRAWTVYDTRKGEPIPILNGAANEPLAGTYVGEHRPLMLLALGYEKEGLAELGKLLDEGGGRAHRLRIAAAALLQKRGERREALALLSGSEAAVAAARRMVETRRQIPGAIDTGAAGAAEFLIRLAVDLHRQEATRVAITYARLATFLAPDNSETWLVMSELLSAAEQPREALQALAAIPAADPFAATARDARIRLLAAAGESRTAIVEAEALVARTGAGAAEWARLGDLYSQLDRHSDAAEAYAKAIAAHDDRSEQPAWVLHLLRGGALEQADRWPEAKAELEAAYRLAPTQPIVLNYLGYAQLERRENIDKSMGLIAEALKLQPESSEITDSLGWAHYLRGNVREAIELLERAAAGEPADPAINEHLGDAYYTAGRRYEARYAWKAALLYAEEEDATRLRAKIEAGLTPQLASP